MGPMTSSSCCNCCMTIENPESLAASSVAVTHGLLPSPCLYNERGIRIGVATLTPVDDLKVEFLGEL